MSTAGPDATPEGVGAAEALGAPIFVVAPPGAGARLVARAFGAVPGTWTPAGRAGALLSGAPGLHSPDGRTAARLVAADCRPELRERLRTHLEAQVPTAIGSERSHPRLFDASPRDALMVPFLRELFPDATFVYVHRRPGDALADALAMWRAGSAITYPALPGWTGPAWSFLLVPGWEELIGLPLAEIATEQWVRTMRALVADLEHLPPRNWCVTDHDALVARPGTELDRLFTFVGIDRRHASAGAVTQAAGFGPSASNVRAARAELEPYLARTDELADRAGDWIARRVTGA